MSKWFVAKLILLILLSLTPLSIHSLNYSFSATWEGIHIMPLAELNLPIIVKKAIFSNQQQMDTRGYIESNDNDAKFLLNIDKHANSSKKIFHYLLIGNCAYSQTEITSVELSKESTKYLIDKQPTSILVEGNHHDGFLYEVTWYVGTLMKTLECAHKKYDKRIVDNMLVLANWMEVSRTFLCRP